MPLIVKSDLHRFGGSLRHCAIGAEQGEPKDKPTGTLSAPVGKFRRRSNILGSQSVGHAIHSLKIEALRTAGVAPIRGLSDSREAVNPVPWENH